MPKAWLTPWRCLFFSIGLMCVDQLTKSWAMVHLPLRETVSFVPGIGLHLCYNPGIGFSLLANQNTLLIFLTSLILITCLKELYQSYTYKNASPLSLIGYSLILGGGLGNLYDRLTLTAVVDFIHFYFLGFKTPIFNCADIFISLGVLFIIIPEFKVWVRSHWVS